jgi:hypothetical protein
MSSTFKFTKTHNINDETGLQCFWWEFYSHPNPETQTLSYVFQLQFLSYFPPEAHTNSILSIRKLYLHLFKLKTTNYNVLYKITNRAVSAYTAATDHISTTCCYTSSVPLPTCETQQWHNCQQMMSMVLVIHDLWVLGTLSYVVICVHDT